MNQQLVEDISLGIAAPNLDDLVSDWQEKFYDSVRVSVLSLHKGLAQGQPNVFRQLVLAVLPWGLAGLLQGGQQLLRGLEVLCTQRGHQEVRIIEQKDVVPGMLLGHG